MKVTVKKPVEIDIAYVLLVLAINYGDEEIPNDFPLREGDTWKAKVNIDTGVIQDWPAGKEADVHITVKDSGSYSLLDSAGKELALIDGGYVPHGVVPGSYGDTVEIKINAEGRITNWPKLPNVAAFFDEDD